MTPLDTGRQDGDTRRQDGCVFCEIVDGRSPARFEHRVSDDGKLLNHPDLAAFHNRLDWARVMLLIVPRTHIAQAEYWTGDLLNEAAKLGIELGESLCPEGFRLISNFGRPAHQSQEHAHLHVVSGAGPPTSHEGPLIAQNGAVAVHRVDTAGVPLSVKLSHRGDATQKQLWTGDHFLRVGRTAIEYASEHTPDGFRLSSEFQSPASGMSGGGDPGLHLHGGGQLDLYM
ncbi:MAG: HIT family protein [Chloroflexi bacterium]|nr:HIT family protein [Chloroflexota bacterium]